MPSVPTRALFLGWDRVPKGLGAGRVVLLRREGAGPPHSPPVIHTWPFTASWSQHELRPAGRCTCRLPPPAVMAHRDGFPLTPGRCGHGRYWWWITLLSSQTTAASFVLTPAGFPPGGPSGTEGRAPSSGAARGRLRVGEPGPKTRRGRGVRPRAAEARLRPAARCAAAWRRGGARRPSARAPARRRSGRWRRCRGRQACGSRGRRSRRWRR